MAECTYFLIILLLCLFKSVDNSSLCDESFCSTYINDEGCAAPAMHCDINNATHSGLRLPSPTTCNCCQFCLPLYGEGEHCSIGGPGTGTTVGRCGDGLTCALNTTDDETRCVKMTSPCFSLQDDYDEREAKGDIGALEERALCDGKGRHAPVECVPAQTCFCRSEEGERIFGESLNLGPSTLRTMRCGCSLLHDKIQKNISPGVPAPIVGPRCTIDGNFNPVQCINKTCYCVDPVTGIVIDEIKSIDLRNQTITELDCYDPDLDHFPQYSEGEGPYNYTTPCIEEREERIKEIEKSKEEGYNVDFGGGYTECYPDGTFGRIGYTATGSKVCLDDQGRRIGTYEAERGTEEFRTMDCKCAMTSYIMKGSTEKPVCCKNGNFRSIQCRRGMCRCVDSDGRQISPEKSNANELLSCLTLNWKTC